MRIRTLNDPEWKDDEHFKNNWFPEGFGIVAMPAGENATGGHAMLMVDAFSHEGKNYVVFIDSFEGLPSVVDFEAINRGIHTGFWIQ